jgi:hypothetical protein
MYCAGALDPAGAPAFFGIDLACRQVLAHPWRRDARVWPVVESFAAGQDAGLLVALVPDC